MRPLIRLMTIAAAAIAATGCYDRFDAPEPQPAGAGNANITIAALTQMYRGQAVGIGEDLTIAGRVTSTDRAGNFRYSFMVEQDGAAVEILARLTDLHNLYPTGSSVTIRLQGTAMDERNGVKRIGLPAQEYDYYDIDYIPSRVELDRRIVCTHNPQPFGIPACYISMLDRRMCGRLVRVVSLTRADDGAAAPVWGGYNIFEDADEQLRIAVFVSSYANFAGHAVPGDMAAISGILQYGRPDGAEEEMFILKPRDESDFIPY